MKEKTEFPHEKKVVVWNLYQIEAEKLEQFEKSLYIIIPFKCQVTNKHGQAYNKFYVS